MPTPAECAYGGCGAPVEECAAGLVCTDPGNLDGVCVPLPGNPCASDADCTPGDRCADARVCRTPVTVGDLCDRGTPCPSGAICQGSVCQQVVGAGAVCPDDFSGCATGLACVQGTELGHGTCQATPGNGEGCSLDARCEPSLTCVWMTPQVGHCELTVCL